MHPSVPKRAPSLARAACHLAPLALVLACDPPPIPEADPVSTEPSIRITWPPPETPVQGCEIVTVEVENLKLVEFPSSDIVEGEGHYHVYFPGDYEACYTPFCFIDFHDVTETTEPYIVAVLANTAHDELLDADGDRIEHRVPIEFVPGPCELTGAGTGGDSGGGG